MRNLGQGFNIVSRACMYVTLYLTLILLLMSTVACVIFLLRYEPLNALFCVLIGYVSAKINKEL